MSFINLEQGTKVVTTAGTAVPLSATSVGIKEIVIQALGSNSGEIYIGNSSVDSSNGVVLWARGSISLNPGDLKDIYIDSSINGEGVKFLYSEST